MSFSGVASRLTFGVQVASLNVSLSYDLHSSQIGNELTILRSAPEEVIDVLLWRWLTLGLWCPGRCPHISLVSDIWL